MNIVASDRQQRIEETAIAALLELCCMPVEQCGDIIHNTWFYLKKGALHTTLSELMIMTAVLLYIYAVLIWVCTVVLHLKGL